MKYQYATVVFNYKVDIEIPEGMWPIITDAASEAIIDLAREKLFNKRLYENDDEDIEELFETDLPMADLDNRPAWQRPR